MVINGEEKAFLIGDRLFHCALDVTMHYVGGKWKTVILWYLRKDKKRFMELKKHIPEITEKNLSLQLIQLEKTGIVKKERFGEKAPFRTEYSLTDFGETLLPTIESMAAWGRMLGETKGELVAV